MKLRVILKIATATSVILFCIGFAISLYFRMSKTEKAEEFNLYTLVPPDAMTIVDTNSIVDFLKGINELNCSKDNHFLYVSHLFSQLKEYINVLLDETPHGFSRQMNKMLISFHEPDNNRNQVFYCRLGAGDRELVERFIKKYCSTTFPSKYFDYKGEEIRIYPMPDDSFIACYVTSEFLAISYQKKLIEDVIDARLSKKSILTLTGFPKASSTAKMNVQATIHVKMDSLIGGWMEFDMKMNSDAIYFSGANYESDSTGTLMSTLRKQVAINDFPGDILPASTFCFNHRSVSDAYDMLGDTELVRFLAEHSGQSMTACMFHSPDTLQENLCAIASIPMRYPLRAERSLRNLSTVNRISSGNYNLYVLPSNTILPQLLGISDSSLNSYACFYKGCMLMASDKESLIAYIDAINANDVLENSFLYSEVMVNLSESYNLIMMADLGVVFEQPEKYADLIPDFFLHNREFFKYFVLSAQFTTVEDVVYLSLVLWYKGEEVIVSPIPPSLI